MSTGLVEVQRGPVEQQTAYADEGGLDVKDLLAILRRRRWVIAGTVLLATTLALLAGLQLTPKYTAKALVMIDPRQSKVVNVEAVLQGLGTDNPTVETQIRVIKSRDHIESLMDSLALFDDQEFSPASKAKDREAIIQSGGFADKFLSWVPDEWLIATGLGHEPTPVLEQAEPLLLRQAAIERFDDRLRVTQEGRSYVIGISFTSTSPTKAARIVNRAADLYVESQRDLKLDATMRASGFLGGRLEELKEDVERAENAVEEFRARHRLVNAQGGSLKEVELANLARELMMARANQAQSEARVKMIRDLRASGDTLEAVSEVIASPLIINLRQQETQLLRAESELRSLFGEKHPRIQNIMADKTSLQAKMRVEVDRILKTMEGEVKAESAKVASIDKQITLLTTENLDNRELDVQLRQLMSEASASRQLYESFLQRFKETREQQGIVESDARVISVAAPPDKPSSPGPMLFGAVGFTASLMLGTLLALLLERLDNGLRSGRQVEQLLGLPALGLVPRLERLKRNQKPHEYLISKPLSAYAESLRAIFTSLQLSDVDNPPKVVLVTSALPQEGKTTLSLSLATFAARSSQKVILVDLDLRHPSVHRDLGATPEFGFVEYMAGERELREVIQRDETAELDYLPVKRQTANPTDILGSQKMKALITELRSMYDFIVLDSAPLLGVTDSKIAALLADKVLFASKWEATNADTARNGLSHLLEIRASIAGVVLTQVNIRKHAMYGYGDVGQYYGKYQKYYVN